MANDINECKLTVESIIAGSIRPNCKLATSHKLPAKCRCGKDIEDLEHVFFECAQYTHIRQKYEPRIMTEISRDAET